jgi:hypothetical protein
MKSKESLFLFWESDGISIEKIEYNDKENKEDRQRPNNPSADMPND